jgi:hypothetical protein
MATLSLKASLRCHEEVIKGNSGECPEEESYREILKLLRLLKWS